MKPNNMMENKGRKCEVAGQDKGGGEGKYDFMGKERMIGTAYSKLTNFFNFLPRFKESLLVFT